METYQPVHLRIFLVKAGVQLQDIVHERRLQHNTNTEHNNYPGIIFISLIWTCLATNWQVY